MYKKWTFLLILVGFFHGIANAQIATSTKASSPIIVADHGQMTAGPNLAATQLDAPMSTYTVLGTRYWLTSQWDWQGKITHSIHQGGFDDPYGATLWTKDTCARNASGYCVGSTGYAFTQLVPSDVVSLWFVNLYQPQPVNDGELLAFIHEERVGYSGGVQGDQEGKTRIGLAWSVDHGNTWKYLGRIISPYGDPSSHNIQGLPYVIKDGYFYAYYVDKVTTPEGIRSGIAVARASVESVLAAARSGNVGTDLWRKYDGQQFVNLGMGGQATPIAPWGITHSQAVYSSQSGKYYMPLTFMTWPDGAGGRINSSVKIYESSDAVNWSASPFLVLADETAATLRPDSGYQYCSLADRAGAPNAVAGQHFYVYCMKDPYMQSSNFAIYRWEVNVGASIDAFRQSSDFSSSQGPYWQYLRGDGSSSLSNMTWNSSYWAGIDSYTRIHNNMMHPGSAEMPVLAWVAPKTGTILIEGTLRSANPSLNSSGNPNCGDGTGLSVVHNSSQIFTANISAADTVGKSIAAIRNVSQGDGIFFILVPGNNNYCDMTRLDPSIIYQ